MSVVARRVPRFLATGLALALGATVAGAAPISAHDPRTPPRPPGLGAFMEALGSVESNGRYDARNRSSGAYGKYQILPSNWPAWARIYLGRRAARPTAANQERVAAGRLSDLRWGLGEWDRVAHWWLTGDRSPRAGWSETSTRYTIRVMTRFRTGLASPAGPTAHRVLGDRSQAIRYLGTWRVARHAAYTGNRAHASVHRGATMVIRFTGRSIRIVGPVGPTRGRAALRLDGRPLRTIDLWARHFTPRRDLVTLRWAVSGTHRIELRVLGTRGRPAVAIDRIVTGR